MATQTNTGENEMKNEMVNLTIDESMVKSVLEKQIQSAILANLGSEEELLRKMISLAFKQKVNREGKVGSYSSENKYDFLEALSGKAIRDASEEAMKEFLTEKKDVLKKKLVSEMSKQKNQKAIVDAFLKSALDNFDCSWRFSCDVRLKQGE
jgi:hypothetical protein